MPRHPNDRAKGTLLARSVPAELSRYPAETCICCKYTMRLSVRARVRCYSRWPLSRPRRKLRPPGIRHRADTRYTTGIDRRHDAAPRQPRHVSILTDADADGASVRMRTPEIHLRHQKTYSEDANQTCRNRHQTPRVGSVPRSNGYPDS